MKKMLAAMLIFLIPVSAVAQTMAAPVRLRVTGVSGRYEVPGVVAIEERRVVGRNADTDEHFARYVNAAGERPISIVWPGTRVEGNAVSMEGGVLTFAADDDAGPSFVPLNSISKIEVRRSRHSRLVATAAGVIVGVLSFLAAVTATFSLCGDDNSRCINRAAPLVFGGPIAFGTVVGYLVRRASWRQISVTELERELSGGRP